MGVEIERKFLVDASQWKPNDVGDRIVQGYLNFDKDRTVRVRIRGDDAFLCVKGAPLGITRAEFEYAIPMADGRSLLGMCDGLPVDKVRHEVRVGGHTWEVDVYEGALQGLVVAEIELRREDEVFVAPDWVVAEITHDVRYANSNLAKHGLPV